MPLVSVIPNFPRVEDELTQGWDKVGPDIKRAILEITGFPENDVLVNLLHCPFVFADEFSTDITLIAATCPNEKLELRADELCEQVAGVLVDLGYSSGMGTEVWLQFLPGSWCLVKDGKTVDTVPHRITEDIPFSTTTE